ncbi:MAG: NifB/NifX family molybdenum-iron cluster-binding protein [Spirochaetia bacterium]
MRIAFTSTGKEWNSKMDPRFGRTQFIFLYDEEADEITVVDNQEIDQVAHGAGPKTAGKLMELEPDVLITGNGPGGNAGRVLQQAGLPVYAGAGQMTVRQAYEAFINSELDRF